jgi:RNA polymerase sigma factor (sigma-70 family)
VTHPPRDPAGHRPGRSTPELTRAVARGDPAALEAIYRAWFGRVFLAARRATGRDEAFCLDVVQEVMLKVARKLRPMPTETDLERWILTVTRTTAVDLIRRERRRAAREAHRAVPPPQDPAAALAREEQERWAVAQVLAAADGDLVIEREVLERPLAQIAGERGSTPGAVHGRVRRAVVRLGRAAKELFP